MKPRIAARTVYAVPVGKLTPTANAEKCREPWSRAVAMTRNQNGRTITEIRLRDDTRPSDFRVPLPATTEAIMKGCTCPPQPEWPMIAFASDCPLHQIDSGRQPSVK
jgi:hypothetical protein